ncbi:hypothetical protein K1X76_02100 [bacterium]|nr:hypothetical protein [bacterium]
MEYLIFIVSADVSQAQSIKDHIKSQKRTQKKGDLLKYQLFYTLEEWKDYVEKNKKELARKKVMIVGDVLFNEDAFFTVFDDTLESYPDIKATICLFSAVSYGEYLEYCEAYALEPHLFIEKSDSLEKLNEPLEEFLKEDDKPKLEFKISPIFIKKHIAHAKPILENLLDIYYGQGLRDDTAGLFLDGLNKMAEDVKAMELADASKKISLLTEVLSRKRAAGNLKVKKVLRDFLVGLEETLKKLEREI